ncbi:MAG: LamG domain-containing protein [Planctomycetota bacterium]|nr:LamG domain-containing protein [Planctomycetota bacterium]
MNLRIVILVVLLALGFALGALARKLTGGSPAADRDPKPVPAKSGEPGAPAKSEDPKTVTPRTPSARELERAWLNERPIKPPLAAYLFTGEPSDLEPLGGTLAPPGQLDPWKLALEGPVKPGSKGMAIADGGKLISEYAGSALSHAIKQRGAFTIEAQVQPADQEHAGPARIAGISKDGSFRNVTLAQEKNEWVLRVRTTASGENGTKPELRVPGLNATRAHVIASYDGKKARVFINGQEVKQVAALAGALDNWDTRYSFVLGNEAGEPRPWAGTIRFVAVYDRALSGHEARQAFESLYPDGAGLGVIAPKANEKTAPKPPPSDDKSTEDF